MVALIPRRRAPLRYSLCGLGRLDRLRGLLLFPIDFDVVVKNDQNHGGGAKENRKAVEIVVGYHDGLRTVCAIAIGVGVVVGRKFAGLCSPNTESTSQEQEVERYFSALVFVWAAHMELGMRTMVLSQTDN